MTKKKTASASRTRSSSSMAPRKSAAKKPSSAAPSGRASVEVVRESRPRRATTARDRAEALDSRHTGVSYSTGRSNPYSTHFGGILALPDSVAQISGGDPNFHEGILQRHPYVAGIVDQKIERANRARVIVAGDPSNPQSVKIADAARRCFRRIPDPQTVLSAWLRNADFVGFGAMEKVFSRDGDGLVYVSRLIDRPCQNVRFRDDGTAVWLSVANPWTGEEIPQRKMSFLRTGSLNTPYGAGTAIDIYPATVLIEKTVELLFDNLEEFGRPIPTLYMPRAKELMTPDERSKVRAYCRKVHSRFLEVPTSDPNPRIDMSGNATLAASGQVGRPEMAVIEMLMTWIWIREIRVMQTLNKAGGSRAMEEVRFNIADDASRPLCQLADGGLNKRPVEGDAYSGWMSDFCDFNFPNEPEEILPRFETPTISQEDIQQVHDRTMDLIDHGVGGDVSKDWYLRTTGVEKAKSDEDRLGGKPLTRVTETRDGDEPKSMADIVARANELAQWLDARCGLEAA